MKKENEHEIIDAFDYLTTAASPTDCTGLIPSAPQNDSELESYENVYPFLTPYVESQKETSSFSGEGKETKNQ